MYLVDFFTRALVIVGTFKLPGATITRFQVICIFWKRFQKTRIMLISDGRHCEVAEFEAKKLVYIERST